MRLAPANVLKWEEGRHEEFFQHQSLEKLQRYFLVSSRCDEFSRALHYIVNPPGLPRTLYATVVLTMQCNMSCIYCHESGQTGEEKMTPSIARETGKFLAYLVQQGKYHRMILYFYGGEPLLNPDALEIIVNFIQKSSSIPITVIIPTNGLLLADDNHCLNRLDVLGVNIVLQITVDGPFFIHDIRRPGLTKKASYEQVIRAIKKSVARFKVIIRTNIGNDNIRYMGDLLDELTELNLLPRLVDWYASTLAEVIGNHHINREILSREEREKGMEMIWREQVERGIPIQNELGEGLCGILRKSLLTIDCQGGLYPCTGLHSRTEPPGNIFEKKVPWNTVSSPDFPMACRVCTYFPYCGGGCKAMKIVRDNKKYCEYSFFEKVLPVFLKYKYRLFGLHDK